jgi:hypothetical protein
LFLRRREGLGRRLHFRLRLPDCGIYAYRAVGNLPIEAASLPSELQPISTQAIS